MPGVHFHNNLAWPELLPDADEVFGTQRRAEADFPADRFLAGREALAPPGELPGE